MYRCKFVHVGLVLSFLLLLSLISPLTVLADGPIYVDADAGGAGDGSSWANAYLTLQQALDIANANPGATYEIWVAEGVYYPDEGGSHVNNSQTEAFTLSYNNVQLYGGFAATETLRTERDWEAHPTILSGDITQDDTNSDGNHIAETWNDIVDNNAYHVLWLDGATNQPITAATTIDGFIITAGKADNFNALYSRGGGLYCYGEGSGHDCSPTLANVTFSGNFGNNGGGMSNYGYNGQSNPTLSNVTFSGNMAYTGGGMFNYGSNGGNSSPTLTNVTFSGNNGFWGCGGMVNNGMIGGVSSPSLTNVIFNGNHGGDDGGGGLCNIANGGVSNPILTNVTLSGNHANNHGGGMYNSATNGGQAQPLLRNVILWGNAASNATGHQIYNENAGATPVLSYTLIQNGPNDIVNDAGGSITYGPGILTSDPQFVAPVAANFVPTTSGDYHLECNSPAIDTGDNSVVTTATDLDGNARLIDGDSDGLAVVDLGAYDRSPDVTACLRLSKTVSPSVNVAYQSPVTYTVTLHNNGAGADNSVWLTDTLPVQVDFARWVQQTGAAVAGDEITWQGGIAGGQTLTWTWVASQTAAYVEQVNNTAEVSGALHQLTAQAQFQVQEISSQMRLYVDTDAAGSAAGLSWTDAYTNVQDALDRANTHGDYDYEIWVAEGVYYPDDGANHTANAEDEFFTLSYNNVQLYGGFAATETLRTERDWAAHPTILSGDIDHETNPDTTAGGVVTDTAHINGVNAFHVLYLDGETNEAITADTVIDGFTITAGYASGSYPHNYGGGMFNDGENGGNSSPTLSNLTFSGNYAGGGSMYNDGSNGQSNPTLTNVTFSGNTAGDGGGMFNDGSNGQSNPTLTNVTFSGNTADYGGGGMYSEDSSPTLTNVTFSDNTADYSGGGMFNEDSSPILTNVIFSGNSAADYGGGMYSQYSSSPTLSNVTFSGNYAGSDGGGMYTYDEDGGNSSPTLTNVTFSGNYANSDGGGIYNESDGGTVEPVLINVILWGNVSGDDAGHQIYNYEATAVLSYTLIQSGTNDIDNASGGSTTFGPGILTADPLFVAPVAAGSAPTTGGDYRLQEESPAINAGDNSAVTAPTDLDGNTRIQGNTVDLGAYEVFQEQSIYLPLIMRDF